VVILTSASLHRSVWKSHGWNEINEPIYKRTCGYIIKTGSVLRTQRLGNPTYKKPTRICGWNVMGASSDRPIGHAASY